MRWLPGFYRVSGSFDGFPLAEWDGTARFLPSFLPSFFFGSVVAFLGDAPGPVRVPVLDFFLTLNLRKCDRKRQHLGALVSWPQRETDHPRSFVLFCVFPHSFSVFFSVFIPK